MTRERELRLASGVEAAAILLACCVAIVVAVSYGLSWLPKQDQQAAVCLAVLLIKPVYWTSKALLRLTR